jgi:putative sterol carrier protein
MPVFEKPEQLYGCIGGLLNKMGADPLVLAELQSLKLKVKFTFHDPESSIFLTVENGTHSIYYGATNQKPDIELAMSGDIAHYFWMGEVNVMQAITKQQIIASGSLGKIMKLVPLIKASIKLYPQHYEQSINSIS